MKTQIFIEKKSQRDIGIFVREKKKIGSISWVTQTQPATNPTQN